VNGPSNVNATARTLAAAVVLATLATAPAASAARLKGHAALRPGTAAVSLAQCLTAGVQSERSATFAGEMTMLQGAARMQMRIELLELAHGEQVYHQVSAPDLSEWRSSAPGVKVFKYLKQVTNLSAPASYRANVHFRWLGVKGRVLRTEQLRTASCEQPAPPATVTPGAGTGTPVQGETA
jgi:hypothetical protein